jgi:transcriptional regulator with XRE-family HTH domain
MKIVNIVDGLGVHAYRASTGTSTPVVAGRDGAVIQIASRKNAAQPRERIMQKPQDGENELSPDNRLLRSKRRRSTDIDQRVGARIRARRIMLGLTQQQLSDAVGVTYQQAHKYERGVDRISAGRLFQIAEALNVPTSYFYEDLGADAANPATSHERMVLELARNFSGITNQRHQEALSQLARALAGADH